MTKRERTNNTMTKRERTNNTMTKRERRNNTMTKGERTNNTMTKRERTNNTMTKRERTNNDQLLCCPVICLYVLSSVLWCPLLLFGSYLPPVVCKSAYVLFTLYLFTNSGVQHILCCVFALCFFVLCTLYCKFLWT